MAEPRRLLGGLGDKLKVFGDKVEAVAKTAGNEGVKGVKVVGTGVLAATLFMQAGAEAVADRVQAGAVQLAGSAVQLKNSVLDSDLDRLRMLHEFQKQQRLEASKYTGRKQLTEKELTEADRQADAVLTQLPAGYFEQDYDPVRHQLQLLTDQAEQEEIDVIVERLGTCVEAVSGKLSRHVVKKRHQLINGISVVATVEDDLKAALASARTSRGTVQAAGDEVIRHLRVARQTRRKQCYMQVMEIINKVKQARDLQRLLRRAQEKGEYREAILLCVRCFQNVDSLKELKVADELLATVQRLYVDTLQRLDGALTAICREFDPVRFTKVLDGFLLQGASGTTLAERVLQCFKDATNDATSCVVSSTLLSQAQSESQVQRSMLSGSFVTMCEALPVDVIGPCFRQMLQAVLQVLASFHAMSLWHTEAIAQQQRQAEQPQDAAVAAADAATMDFLTSVSAMLTEARQEVFGAAAARLMILLQVPAVRSGKGLLQVAHDCENLVCLGEAFCGGELSELRAHISSLQAAAFEALHHSSMEKLSRLMQQEGAWKNVGGTACAEAVAEGSLLNLAAIFGTPPSSLLSGARDFDAWLSSSEPFGSSSPCLRWQPQPGQLPVITASGQHMLQCLHTYAQLLRPLGAVKAGAVWQAVTQLYDRFLTASFMLLSGVTVDALVLQDDVVSMRLRGVLRRILTADGSRYKAQIEELRRVKATQLAQHRGIPGQGTGLSSWLDKFGDKMESLATNLDIHVSKISNVIGENVKVAGAMANIQFEGGGASGIAPGSDGLAERAAAGESLAIVAAELRAGRAALLPVLQAAAKQVAATTTHTDTVSAAGVASAVHSSRRLLYDGMRTPSPGPAPPAAAPPKRLVYEGMPRPTSTTRLHQDSSTGNLLQHSLSRQSMGEEASVHRPLPPVLTTPALPREADMYIGRVVESALDLKTCLLQGSARSLLAALLHPERGLAGAVAHTPTYSGKEPAVRHSPWVEGCSAQLKQFAAAVAMHSENGIVPEAVQQVWGAALALVADAITLGLSRVKHCSLEGRAAMTNDLSALSKVVRQLVTGQAAAAALQPLQTADEYVRAYYLPWDELVRWCLVKFEQVGLPRLLPLVELASEVHRVRKPEKQQLIDQLSSMAQELA